MLLLYRASSQPSHTTSRLLCIGSSGGSATDTFPSHGASEVRLPHVDNVHRLILLSVCGWFRHHELHRFQRRRWWVQIRLVFVWTRSSPGDTLHSVLVRFLCWSPPILSWWVLCASWLQHYFSPCSAIHAFSPRCMAFPVLHLHVSISHHASSLSHHPNGLLPTRSWHLHDLPRLSFRCARVDVPRFLVPRHVMLHLIVLSVWSCISIPRLATSRNSQVRSCGTSLPSSYVSVCRYLTSRCHGHDNSLHTASVFVREACALLRACVHPTQPHNGDTEHSCRASVVPQCCDCMVFVHGASVLCVLRVRHRTPEVQGRAWSEHDTSHSCLFLLLFSLFLDEPTRSTERCTCGGSCHYTWA